MMKIRLKRAGSLLLALSLAAVPVNASEVAPEDTAAAIEQPAEAAAVDTPVLNVASQNNESGLLVLKLDNAIIPQGATVFVPTWTEDGGQDDIVWYMAEQKSDGFYVTVRAANHGYQSGTYVSHAYVQGADGAMTFLTHTKNALSVSLKPSIDVSVNGGKAVVTLQNAVNISSASTVYFPTWGDANGQNDVVWYQASYVSPGVWTAVIDLANHGEFGRYTVHAYVDQGGLMALTAGSFDVNASYSGTVSVSEKDDDLGTFTIKIDNVTAPGGVKEVLVPVWSEADGQDDIVWYSAKQQGSSWYVYVDSDNHKNSTGRYAAHVYVRGYVGDIGFAGYTYADVKRSTNITVKAAVDAQCTKMTVTLKNYVSKSPEAAIRFAVWGDKNGQNDIVWYEAVKSGKNTYTYTVDLKKHNEIGQYQIHVYDISSGINFVTNATAVVGEIINCGSMYVTDVNQTNGTFRVNVNNVTATSGVAAVKVSVWADLNGQDDLKWYNAKKAGDTWYVDVNTIKDHNVVKGTYTARVYAYSNEGNSDCLGDTTAQLTWDLSTGKPGIDVSEWQYNIDWPAVKASGVQFAMVRTGYSCNAPAGRDYEDKTFQYNIKNAKANGIKVGVYHYSYAESTEEAVEEAKFCLEILKKSGVALDYPIAFDFEESSRAKKELREENTAIIKAFCDYIEQSGYDAMLYINPNFINNYVNYNEVKHYGTWLASWHSNISSGYGDYDNVKIWQYSSKGNVNGIGVIKNGKKEPVRVDMNISYIK